MPGKVLGEAERAPRAGVHPLICSDELPEGSSALTEALEAEVSASGAELTPGSRLAPLIAELGQGGLRCAADDVECLSKIGIYTGIDLLLVPALARTAEGWALSLLLVDTLKGQALGQATVGAATDLSQDLDQARVAARELMARGPGDGALRVRLLHQGIEVRVDQARVDAAMAEARVEVLPAGEHEIEVRAPGQEPQRLRVDVTAGETTVVDVTLASAALTPAPPVKAAPEPAPAVDPAPAWPLWVGASLVALGAATGLAGALTGVTGEMSYRIAGAQRVDMSDASALEQRRDDMEQSSVLAVAGVGLGALGGAMALGGAGLLGWAAVSGE